MAQGIMTTNRSREPAAASATAAINPLATSSNSQARAQECINPPANSETPRTPIIIETTPGGTNLQEATQTQKNMALLAALAMAFGPHFAKQISSLKSFYLNDHGWNPLPPDQWYSGTASLGKSDTDLNEHGSGMTNTQWGLFQSAMVFPNFVIPIIGGYLSNSPRGIKCSVVIFLWIVLFGDLIFWYATTQHAYYMALIGRVITGSGEGVASSLSGAVASLFFNGKHLAFAIGITESFHAFSNSFAKASLAPAAEWRGYYSDGVLISVGACIISFVAGSIWVWTQPLSRIYSEVQTPSQGIPGFHFQAIVRFYFVSCFNFILFLVSIMFHF